jgi:hypothetical protein
MVYKKTGEDEGDEGDELISNAPCPSRVLSNECC